MTLSMLFGGWQLLKTFWITHETNVALDHIEFFEKMRISAMKGQIEEAVSCLENVATYWPSGTIHTAGTSLDRMVEQARARFVREIIADLRKKSGEDLGDDPEPWIKKYGKK